MPGDIPRDARNGQFQIANATGTTFTLAPGNLSSVDGLPGTRELIDTSKIGDSGRTYTASLQNPTFTLEGFYSGSTNSTGAYTILEGLLTNSTAAPFRYSPTGTSCSSPVNRDIYGSCWVRALTITGRVGNVLTFRADMQGEGTLTFADSTAYAR